MSALTVYAQASGNYSTVNWNTAANGSGTSYTNPQNGANTFTCDANGYTVAINVSVTVTQLQSSGAGCFTCATPSITITAALQFSGTAANFLSVTYGGPVINGNCTSTSNTGNLLATSSTGALTVNGNLTGTGTGGALLSMSGSGAVNVNGELSVSNGCAIWSGSSNVGLVTFNNPGATVLNIGAGTPAPVFSPYSNQNPSSFVIIGNIVSAVGNLFKQDTWANVLFIGNTTFTSAVGSGYGGYQIPPYGSYTVIGDIIYQGTNANFKALEIVGGTMTLVGSVYSTSSAPTGLIYVNGGTLNWEGVASIPASNYCAVSVASGTLNLGIDGLTISVSGTLSITASGGTVNQTAATITQQTGGTITSSGCTLAYGTPSVSTDPGAQYVLTSAFGGPSTYTINGTVLTPTATLPAAGDVLSAYTYGVGGNGSTGTLTLPAAGNVVTSNGAYGVGGNGSTPTLTLPAAADVLSGVAVGSGSGTLTLPAVGSVASGVSYGVGGSGSTGTRTDCPAASAVSGTSYGDPGSPIAGTYPTTAASQAAQLATDTAAVTAQQANFPTFCTILGVTGTLPWITVAEIAAAILATPANKLATDSSGRVDLVNAPNATAIAAIQSGLAMAATALSTAQWTNARALYLDNLNIGGAVASHADVLGINQSASRPITLATSSLFLIPASGNNAYAIQMRTFDLVTGAPTNVDASSTPTLTVTGAVSGSLAVNLGSVSNPGAGIYNWTYSQPAGGTQEQLTIIGSATLGGVTYTMECFPIVTDEDTAAWSTTDDTMLRAIYDWLPEYTPAVDATGRVTFNNSSIATVGSLSNMPSIPAGWLTAAGIAAGALDGKGDWLLDSATRRLTTSASATSTLLSTTASTATPPSKPCLGRSASTSGPTHRKAGSTRPPLRPECCPRTSARSSSSKDRPSRHRRPP